MIVAKVGDRDRKSRIMRMLNNRAGACVKLPPDRHVTASTIDRTSEAIITKALDAMPIA